MKLIELQNDIAKLIKSNPEAADMEVMQTSCFDDPYRFETSGLYIGEAFSVADDSTFSNVDDAEERADGEEVEEKTVIVIEAY